MQPYSSSDMATARMNIHLGLKFLSLLQYFSWIGYFGLSLIYFVFSVLFFWILFLLNSLPDWVISLNPLSDQFFFFSTYQFWSILIFQYRLRAHNVGIRDLFFFYLDILLIIYAVYKCILFNIHLFCTFFFKTVNFFCSWKSIFATKKKKKNQKCVITKFSCMEDIL